MGGILWSIPFYLMSYEKGGAAQDPK